MCAAVKQQQTFRTQRGVGVGCSLVMDNGTMSLVGGNGIEGESLIERLFGTQTGKLSVDAHLRLSAGSDGWFQPAQEAHQGDTVANHGLPKATLFGLRFHGLHCRNGGMKVES